MKGDHHADRDDLTMVLAAVFVSVEFMPGMTGKLSTSSR